MNVSFDFSVVTNKKQWKYPLKRCIFTTSPLLNGFVLEIPFDVIGSFGVALNLLSHPRFVCYFKLTALFFSPTALFLVEISKRICNIQVMKLRST